METPGQFAGATSGLNNAMTNAGTAQGGISTALGYDPTAITNETVNTQKFTDSGVADSYMSPYMQNVVDVQSAEARRQADITKAGMGMQSIGRGTFGGGREALMQSEADRNLARLPQDERCRSLLGDFRVYSLWEPIVNTSM